MELLKLSGLTFVTFLGIDFLWLSKVAPKLYKEHIGHLMAAKPNLIAGGVFYVIYIVGLVVFVVQPAVDKQSVAFAATRGALFGLIAYATFDLTSMAVLKDWPLKITLIDLAWGSVLTASVCALTTFIALKLAN